MHHTEEACSKIEQCNLPVSQSSIGFFSLFSPRFIVSASTMLHCIVCVLWICLHGDLCCAGGAPQVKPVQFQQSYQHELRLQERCRKCNDRSLPENLDSQVRLSCYVLFRGIEFGSFVHVVATRGTPNAHGKHHAHFHGVVLGPLALGQLRRIEIRRKVLVQHFALTHIDWVWRSASKVKLLLILRVLR